MYITKRNFLKSMKKIMLLYSFFNLSFATDFLSGDTKHNERISNILRNYEQVVFFEEEGSTYGMSTTEIFDQLQRLTSLDEEKLEKFRVQFKEAYLSMKGIIERNHRYFQIQNLKFFKRVFNKFPSYTAFNISSSSSESEQPESLFNKHNPHVSSKHSKRPRVVTNNNEGSENKTTTSDSVMNWQKLLFHKGRPQYCSNTDAVSWLRQSKKTTTEHSPNQQTIRSSEIQSKSLISEKAQSEKFKLRTDTQSGNHELRTIIFERLEQKQSHKEHYLAHRRASRRTFQAQRKKRHVICRKKRLPHRPYQHTKTILADPYRTNISSSGKSHTVQSTNASSHGPSRSSAQHKSESLPQYQSQYELDSSMIRLRPPTPFQHQSKHGPSRFSTRLKLASFPLHQSKYGGNSSYGSFRQPVSQSPFLSTASPFKVTSSRSHSTSLFSRTMPLPPTQSSVAEASSQDATGAFASLNSFAENPSTNTSPPLIHKKANATTLTSSYSSPVCSLFPTQNTASHQPVTLVGYLGFILPPISSFLQNPNAFVMERQPLSLQDPSRPPIPSSTCNTPPNNCSDSQNVQPPGSSSSRVLQRPTPTQQAKHTLGNLNQKLHIQGQHKGIDIPQETTSKKKMHNFAPIKTDKSSNACNNTFSAEASIDRDITNSELEDSSSEGKLVIDLS